MTETGGWISVFEVPDQPGLHRPCLKKKKKVVLKSILDFTFCFYYDSLFVLLLLFVTVLVLMGVGCWLYSPFHHLLRLSCEVGASTLRANGFRIYHFFSLEVEQAVIFSSSVSQ